MIRLFGTDCHDCEKFKDNVPCYDDYRFCEKSLAEHNKKVRADAIKEIVSYLHEYDIIDCNCCTENNRCDRDCWDILAEQLKEQNK